MSDSRILVAFVKLPDRRDRPMIERQAHREADIRDAMAQAARKLHDEATKINAGGRGFKWDYDTIIYDVARIAHDSDVRHAVPTIVATMKMERPQ